MTITAIRLLPPLAIARLGSAREPLDNYTLEEDADRPLGYRRIKGALTLIVDDATGQISRTRTPTTVSFKQGSKVRPVAPFLEVFALTDKGLLEPLTLELLRGPGLDPGAVQWCAEVQNRKAFRRTGDEGDIVKADTGWFGGHEPQKLAGRCENFVTGATIDFGNVRYISPNCDKPEIRLRFMPAQGLVYGPNTGCRDRKIIPDERAVYDATKGSWHHWEIATEAAEEEEKEIHETLPPSLFAIEPPAPPWLHDDKAVSRGYLDDACDGFIHVKLTTAPGQELTASARISAGPPDFVPDSMLVRTLADDLEQIVHGPQLTKAEAASAQARAEDIVRRAFETARFMNIAVMNGNTFKGRAPLELDTQPAEEAFDTERMLRPIMAPQNVDTLSVIALHQQVFAALRSGTAPWFASLLRLPEEAGDLTDRGRRKMPALMAGADSYYLALTRRQIDTIARAARGGAFDGAEPPPADAVQGTRQIEPRNLTAQLFYEAAGNPINSRPMMSAANCIPGLEMDFRAVWRRLFEGITLSEHDNYVLESQPPHDALEGCRLLCVDGKPVVATLIGPSPASPNKFPPVIWDHNKTGAFCLEWSNSLAHALRRQGEKVECLFTLKPTVDPVPFDAENSNQYRKVSLKVRRFFEEETAVISRELAASGELTQGLCSPWHNDLRECSCYYWAGSRPDYVNVEPTLSGGSRGDNWFQRTRTGDYVPDDYIDPRLIGFDDLFLEWERILRFQIGGRDEPERSR